VGKWEHSSESQETFTFLGFTHGFWGRLKTETFAVRPMTAKK